jgi:hypothetical protein
LIALLVGLGFGTVWTVNLVRFGLPPPIGQNCGSLQNSYYYYYANQSVPAGETLQQLSCFWLAYQTCRAATISQTLAGTDVGHTDTLTIERRNDRCEIYGHEDYWVNTDRSSGVTICTQLSKQEDDLLVSECDGADPITLYARIGANESYLCGIVNSTQPFDSKTPQDREGCFYAAYQHCLADSLRFSHQWMLSRQSTIFISIIIALSRTRGGLVHPQMRRSWQHAPAWRCATMGCISCSVAQMATFSFPLPRHHPECTS